jgi:hypothetical protein
VYRWNSESANAAGARHYCGEAHAEVYISRWFESVWAPPKPSYTQRFDSVSSMPRAPRVKSWDRPRLQEPESAGSTKVVTCAVFALLPLLDFLPPQLRTK